MIYLVFKDRWIGPFSKTAKAEAFATRAGLNPPHDCSIVLRRTKVELAERPKKVNDDRKDC